MPPADDLHSVVTVDLPIAFLLVDVQVLVGVVVFHMVGVVKPDAADGVYHLPHQLPVYLHIVIRRKSHQLGHLPEQSLPALLVTPVKVRDSVQAGIDGAAAHVDQRVSGQGHDSGLLVGHVIGGDHHGIGAPGGNILAHHKKGEDILALSSPAHLGLDRVEVQGLLGAGVRVRVGGFDRLIGFAGRRRQGGLLEQADVQRHRRRRKNHNHRRHDHDDHDALFSLFLGLGRSQDRLCLFLQPFSRASPLRPLLMRVVELIAHA